MGGKGIIIVSLVVMVCGLIIPRWYYQVHGASDPVSIVNAIYTAMAIEIGALGMLIGLKK